MKIVLLTSDILDGLIVCQKLIDSGMRPEAVIYERKPLTLKASVKRFLYIMKGIIKSPTYIGMMGKKAFETDDINGSRVIETLNKISPGLIVVAGTRKLKKEIYGIAKKGAINLHSGILPYYRGADSEFWALYNGDTDRIGVTIHFVSDELDGGDIILQARQNVAAKDDHRSLRMKNIVLGAEKIVEAVRLIEKGDVKRQKQDSSQARTYKSARPEDVKEYRERYLKGKRKKEKVVKEFGPEGLKVTERVAKEPLGIPSLRKPDTFTLRIDADEYEKVSFGAYYPLFEKYKDAVSIYFNVNSFKDAGNEIKKCAGLGIDVGSHGFYHHTYNDYASNLYNIKKAKEFFLGLGIETRGFVAPMGKWNASLMQALEEEGYLYSSDFSYDYMGAPSYPLIGGKWSKVLEIPVFPVSPELFYEKHSPDMERVVQYYKDAIDAMINANIPVIIYAHTSPLYRDIPKLLELVCDYAINVKKLKPTTMSLVAQSAGPACTRDNECAGGARCSARLRASLVRCSSTLAPPACQHLGDMKMDRSRHPSVNEYFGRETRVPIFDRFKDAVKDAVDFERITPEGELKCGAMGKFFKIAARKIF